MNQSILIGRLTRDPEMRVLQNGTATTRFTVAVDRALSKDKKQEAEQKGQGRGVYVMDKEIWKDITGYEGYYQISNKSRAKSLARKRHKTEHGKGGWLKERILKQSVNSDGYFTVVLTKKGTRKPYKVHRLVAKYFIPNKEGKPEVNHIDGDKLNNDIENLEWVTKAENVRHAYKNNLNPVKLNISKSELVSLIEKGMYARDMAKALGCSEKTVRNRARKYKVTIPTPTRKTKFGIDGDIVRSKLRHQSVREMAEELGCSVDLIYYYKNNSKRSM